jgi:hypothetical protein
MSDASPCRFHALRDVPKRKAPQFGSIRLNAYPGYGRPRDRRTWGILRGRFSARRPMDPAGAMQNGQNAFRTDRMNRLVSLVTW